MDATFSSSLDLNRMSTSTIVVLWGMIIFLLILVSGIAIYFKRELNKKDFDRRDSITSNKSGKGF